MKANCNKNHLLVTDKTRVTMNASGFQIKILNEKVAWNLG